VIALTPGLTTLFSSFRLAVTLVLPQTGEMREAERRVDSRRSETQIAQ
jgi:hypothetical protein